MKKTVFYSNWTKDKEGKGVRLLKPSKSKEPFVGSYNDHQSKDYTLRRSYSCKFDKNKGNKFTVEVSNKKKFVPGVGAYKGYENAYNHISRPMRKK